MDAKYEALFTPWRIGKVEIKNRIVMCPMGGTSLFGWMELTGCHFDKEAAKLFMERAENNVGLIITGIAPVRDTIWGKWLWQNPKMFDDLKEFMDEIHKTGAKVFIQPCGQRVDLRLHRGPVSAPDPGQDHRPAEAPPGADLRQLCDGRGQ